MCNRKRHSKRSHNRQIIEDRKRGAKAIGAFLVWCLHGKDEQQRKRTLQPEQGKNF